MGWEGGMGWDGKGVNKSKKTCSSVWYLDVSLGGWRTQLLRSLSHRLGQVGGQRNATGMQTCGAQHIDLVGWTEAVCVSDLSNGMCSKSTQEWQC